MPRPTRCCAKCGEYVSNEIVSRTFGREITTKVVLCHIDADGHVIYRNHAAVEDKPDRQ